MSAVAGIVVVDYHCSFFFHLQKSEWHKSDTEDKLSIFLVQ